MIKSPFLLQNYPLYLHLHSQSSFTCIWTSDYLSATNPLSPRGLVVLRLRLWKPLWRLPSWLCVRLETDKFGGGSRNIFASVG